jgi:hypothetical protein
MAPDGSLVKEDDLQASRNIVINTDGNTENPPFDMYDIQMKSVG